MPTVCVGPELEPDPQGRLRIKLCGTPLEQAWPFPCPPSTRNPVRIDPDCGLWVPPAPALAVVQASGSTAQVQQAVSSDFKTVDTADITITNPSTCYEALVLQMVSVDVDFSLPEGADSHAAARLGGNEFQDVTNPAGSGGTEMSFTHWEYTQPVWDAAAVVPAGGSQAFSTPIEVGQGGGGAQFRGCRWSITALVMAGLS